MAREFGITLATRGSALALAQTRMILKEFESAFPKLHFEIKVIKTTGDKLLTASMSQGAKTLPKGLFTKELEVALQKDQADMAIHSLKDLPTELPAGLKLGAVSKRADPRDVLIYRDRAHVNGKEAFAELAAGAVVGTSSTRRRAQLLAQRPDLRIVELRGNVIGRLQKLAAEKVEALILAAAGLERLNWKIAAGGQLTGQSVPEGLHARVLGSEEILPCVGQGALGIEIREDDIGIGALCDELNDYKTNQCVTAERSFLSAMGGGCASPVAAYAEVVGEKLRLRAMSFPDGIIRRANGEAEQGEAVALGERLAAELKRREQKTRGNTQ
jgi:hydroxymethylbilane synthase